MLSVLANSNPQVWERDTLANAPIAADMPIGDFVSTQDGYTLQCCEDPVTGAKFLRTIASPVPPGPVIVHDRRDHSVNGASIDGAYSPFPAPVLRTQTQVNNAGGFNGGGVGNKAILGFWIPLAIKLSQLNTLQLDYEQVTPEAGLVGNCLPYLNLVVELDPFNFPGLYQVLVLGDPQNVALNLGTYTTPGIYQHRTTWDRTLNFLQVVGDKGTWVGASPPSPLGGPDPIPVAEGPVQAPGNWNSHDFALADILTAYPSAHIINGNTLDGGMPLAPTVTAGVLIVLGNSGELLQNAVRILGFSLNGVPYL